MSTSFRNLFINHLNLLDVTININNFDNLSIVDKTDDYIKVSKNIQLQLKNKIKLQNLDYSSVHYVCGLDMSCNLYSNLLFSCASLFSVPDLKLIELSFVYSHINFPYIPGFLSFREAPGYIEAIKNLSKTLDLLIVDGHGIIHPRGIGIASHLGVALNIPSIGVAKSLLIGKYNENFNLKKNNSTSIYIEDELKGFAYCSKSNCKPIFISPGHLVTIRNSIDIIPNLVDKYKIPEPTRLSHFYSNEFRKCYYNNL